ncbi:MAG: hypothetical protein MUF85_02965 [Patescibacteria group bacterium]|nr:hypothetical protein [Patescibacteria group bacterium]
MIATFMLEIAMAVYVIFNYRHLFVARLITATLLCLGSFQLAEWMVCQGAMGISSMGWAKIGFVAISFLPPLGIHISNSIAGKKNNKLIATGYGLAVVFSGYFLFATRGISDSICGGNYVIFQLAPGAVNMFSGYYYMMLLIGTGIALYYSVKTKDTNIKSALQWMSIGYISFMLPTVLAVIRYPSASSGIPSIMCGFAVLLALILVLFVLPRYLASLKTVSSNSSYNKDHKTSQA